MSWIKTVDKVCKEVGAILATNSGIFGLEVWTWKFTESQDLLLPDNRLNDLRAGSPWDMLFKNEDRSKVQEMIRKYKRRRKSRKSLLSKENAKTIIEPLSQLAIYQWP